MHPPGRAHCGCFPSFFQLRAVVRCDKRINVSGTRFGCVPPFLQMRCVPRHDKMVHVCGTLASASCVFLDESMPRPSERGPVGNGSENR